MDEINRVSSLYKSLHRAYETVRLNTPKSFEELEHYSSQVSKYLSGVADTCIGEEAKSICAVPEEIVARMSARLKQLNSKLEGHTRKCQGCADAFRQWHDQLHGQLEEVKKLRSLSVEDNELCRQFDFSLNHREETWEFFAAMPAISLSHLISELVDLMATLIGQPNAARS